MRAGDVMMRPVRRRRREATDGGWAAYSGLVLLRRASRARLSGNELVREAEPPGVTSALAEALRVAWEIVYGGWGAGGFPGVGRGRSPALSPEARELRR